MSGYRNLTASQEARRRAHQQTRREERGARPTRPAGPPCPELQPCALALTLALWRDLDRKRPGGLTMLDVARVAVEHWGEAMEPAVWRATNTLLESKMLRQVGQVIVRDRTQVVYLPAYVPAERWHG